MDESIFLREIDARPAEELPRLILADWLEEQGDPRAGFIRAACEAEQLPRQDARRLELEQTCRDLEPATARLWLGDDRDTLRELTYDRGIPAGITLSAYRFIRNGEQFWEKLPTLRGLELVEARNYWADVLECPHLKQVRRLTLRQLDQGENQLAPEQLAMLLNAWRLERLESLDLHNCVIGSEANHALMFSPHLHHLRHLGLWQSDDVNRATFRSGLSLSSLSRTHTLDRLESLTLSGLAVTTPAIRELLEWPRLEQLTRLHLDRWQVYRSPWPVMREYPWFSRLRHLELSHCGWVEDYLPELLDRQSFPELRTLRLQRCYIADGNLPHLAEADMQPEILDLTDHSLSVDGAIRLAAAPVLGRIRELHLAARSDIHGRAGLRAEGVRQLLGSHLLGQLEYLDLSGNRIGSDGLKALAECPDLKNLRYLDVSANDIGRLGAECLSRSDCLPNLAVLILRDNRITDEGYAALVASEKLPALRQLNVVRNGLTQEWVESVQTDVTDRLLSQDIRPPAPRGELV